MRLGCIGVGSNAIRLLNAQWDGTTLCAAMRERRGTRLFAGLCGGMLTKESMDASVEAVGELARLAREDGACGLFVFATSAVPPVPNIKPTVETIIEKGMMRFTAAKGVFPAKLDTKKPSTTP